MNKWPQDFGKIRGKLRHGTFFLLALTSAPLLGQGSLEVKRDQYRGEMKDFVLLQRDFGEGYFSHVSRILHKESGVEYVHKRPKKKLYLKKVFPDEIKAAKQWQRAGLTDMKVFWDSEKKGLIKTLIKGQTLDQLLTSGNFLGNQRAQKQLQNLIFEQVKKHRYFPDIHHANIIYGEQTGSWHFIDGGTRDLLTLVPRHVLYSYRHRFTFFWKSLIKLHQSRLEAALKAATPLQQRKIQNQLKNLASWGSQLENWFSTHLSYSRYHKWLKERTQAQIPICQLQQMWIAQSVII